MPAQTFGAWLETVAGDASPRGALARIVVALDVEFAPATRWRDVRDDLADALMDWPGDLPIQEAEAALLSQPAEVIARLRDAFTAWRRLP